MGGEGLPFGPLAHAFRSLMRDTSPEELDEFMGPARSELGQVLPDLDPDGALGRAALGEGGTARLLELVVGVIERLAADRPLMFVIEHLHWADRSTLDLVALLVRALHADRVLVVVTFRSDELHRSHPPRPLVTGWERVRTVGGIASDVDARRDTQVRVSGRRFATCMSRNAASVASTTGVAIWRAQSDESRGARAWIVQRGVFHGANVAVGGSTVAAVLDVAFGAAALGFAAGLQAGWVQPARRRSSSPPTCAASSRLGQRLRHPPPASPPRP